jgi:hypothetical protein
VKVNLEKNRKGIQSPNPQIPVAFADSHDIVRITVGCRQRCGRGTGTSIDFLERDEELAQEEKV